MNRSRSRRLAAFTLAEVMVATGIFAIMAGSTVQAMLRMNNNATLSRLQTGASTTAQNQIDLILTDMPFNPQKGQVPPALTIGTTTEGSVSNPTVPIYTDPKSGEVVVKGWMTTTVADTGASLSGVTLYAYRAGVTVNYRFRNRLYSVTMNTVRASDL